MRILITAIGVALALASAPAWAEPTATQKETARGLMTSGDSQYARGNYAGALEAYQSADAIMGVPTTALAVARARAKLGQLVEALDAIGRVRRFPKTDHEPSAYAGARSDAAELEEQLLPRVAVVHVTVVGLPPDRAVEISVDGEKVLPIAGLDVRVNPGKRVVVARSEGYLEATANVDLAAGASQTVSLELVPDPSYVPPAAEPVVEPAPVERPLPIPREPADEGVTIAPWTYASLAAGGVGLLVGIGTGAAVLAKTSDLEERCGGTVCDASLEPEHDDIDTLATVSNVAFALGAAGLVAGGVLLTLDLLAADGVDPTAARLILAPGFVGVGGSF